MYLDYEHIYRTIAIKTKDNRMLVLSLEDANNMLYSSNKEKRWVIQKYCYPPSLTNNYLLPIEKIKGYIKENIEFQCSGCLHKPANIKIYSKFVTFNGLQTHILNAINNAITIEDYVKVSTFSSFCIHVLPINTSYTKDFNCKTTEEFIYAMSNIDKYSNVIFDLPETFIIPQRLKHNTNGFYYVYRNNSVLSKNKKEITWCELTNCNTNMYSLSSDNFKGNRYQPILFKNIKEAIQFYMNFSYDIDYKCSYIKSDSYIGKYNDIHFNEKNIPILDLAKLYGLYVDFFVIYLPKFDQYYQSVGSKNLYYGSKPYKFFTESAVRAKLKDLTEYRDYGLVLQIKRVIGNDIYLIDEYMPKNV